jgi:hypothetical protein
MHSLFTYSFVLLADINCTKGFHCDMSIHEFYAYFKELCTSQDA